MTKKTDILIVGAGSAGFGAAYRALLNGNYRVTLIDKNPGLGGTSTYGGVNNWEPGYGGKGVHHLLASRLIEEGSSIVGENVEEVTDATPWGLSVRSEDPYEETLERSFRGRMEQRRFHFEPQAMADAMLDVLKDADTHHQLDLMLHTTVTDVKATGRKITEVTARNQMGTYTIHPKI